MSPRFILGEDEDLVEWLVHLHQPRFACRVAAAEDAASHPDRFDFGFACFTDFQWIDAQPDRDDLAAILDDAATFVEALSE